MNDSVLVDKRDLLWLLEMTYGYIDDCDLGGYSKAKELAVKYGFSIEDIKKNNY